MGVLGLLQRDGLESSFYFSGILIFWLFLSVRRPFNVHLASDSGFLLSIFNSYRLRN